MTFNLNDQLFNPETVARLAGHFGDAGVFDAAPFEAEVLAGMGPLALKARIGFMAEVLARHLPADFPAAVAGIMAALPPPLDPDLTDDDFGHFIYAPLGVFIERHGIDTNQTLALDALEAITQRFSMEFSLRAFLIAHKAQTLERVMDWTQHSHYHVRRLASEGTRPRLPWGQNVGLSPAETLPVLDRLYGDNTRFVTRSVANHLNDITKFDADVVIDRLAGWQRPDAKELDWLRRHALRGLIKAGHAGAMAHLGYAADVAVTLEGLQITPDALARGEAAEVAFTLTCPQDAPLIVDYVIDFVKANGQTAPRVFKLKQVVAKGGVPVAFKKRHVFKGNATTFKLYPGAHHLHVQVNGRIVGGVPFILQ